MSVSRVDFIQWPSAGYQLCRSVLVPLEATSYVPFLVKRELGLTRLRVIEEDDIVIT